MEKSVALLKAFKAIQIIFSPLFTKNKQQIENVFYWFKSYKYESIWAYSCNCSTASEEYISQASRNSIYASDFRLKRSESDWGVYIA